ncbi:hypothetical protein ACN28G_19735 [Micromonospora sp. WMMA1923]|uniref:hypothetical protein n=1 Tax=Micromonospora sp. WMMA1923 TaxID=3404125 RepID=UPI003B925D9E
MSRGLAVVAARSPRPSTRWTESRAADGRRVRHRFTAAAVAQADQVRAAGRTPVPKSWEGHYPDGGPAEITVTAVR